MTSAIHMYDARMFGTIDFPGHMREAIGMSHWMFTTAIQNCQGKSFLSPDDEIWYALEHYMGNRLNELPDHLLNYVTQQMENYHRNVQFHFCQRQPIADISYSDRHWGVAVLLKE